jgi:hypothetical protein
MAKTAIDNSGTTRIALFNFEPPRGKTYVIDDITIGSTTTDTRSLIRSIQAAAFPFDPLDPTLSLSVVVPTSLFGKGVYNGLAAFGANQDSAGLELGPIGRSVVCANTSNVTFSVQQNVTGRFIIPPSCAFVTQNTINPGNVFLSSDVVLLWHEVQLPT